MQIKVTCVSCGNQTKVTRARAGQCFPCDLCGGVMPVPSYHGKKDPFIRMTYAPPSIFQRLAAIFGFLVGLAGFAGGAIILFSGAAATSDVARPETGYLTGGALVAVAAAFVATGLIYFFAGLNIRDNGAVSAIIVLVIGPAHALVLAANLLMVVALRGAGGESSTMLKNAFFYDATTLALLVIYILCAIFSLATQDGLPRLRASRYFLLLCVYGFMAFAALVGYQGFLIMGHPLNVQLPPQVIKNLAPASAVWLGAAMFFWLVSFAVARTRVLGGILGLLLALPPAVAAGWYLYGHAPGVLARHDATGYLTLAAVGFFALVMTCPVILLLTSLFSPAPKLPDMGTERPLERFAFDA